MARALVSTSPEKFQPRGARAGGAREALQRLEPLVPDAARVVPGDAAAYALEYVRRFSGDVAQLEHEWAFLYATLTSAFARGNRAIAARLAAGLARVVCRIDDVAAAERALRLGIAASHGSRDRRRRARLLNRLGILLFTHGRYAEGRELWMTSLKGTAAAPGAPGFWDPLPAFAQIADLLGNGAEPSWFGEPFSSDPRRLDRDTLAVLHFASGLYARLRDRVELAAEHLDACLGLLAPAAARGPAAAERRLVLAAAQTELARARGDYARAHAWAETTVALARLYGDRYTVAAVLGDQAMYSLRVGRLDDALPVARALRVVASGMKAPHIAYWSRYFEERLPGMLPDEPEARALPGARALLAAPKPATDEDEPASERLSDREVEVLRLVAAGLSSRAIADELVIAPGTVKKHLEHIFAKLRVTRRTAAVARGRHLGIVT